MALACETGRPAQQRMSCNHRLCPWCAPKRAKRVKAQLAPVIGERFNRAVLVTLTHDDRHGETLASAFDRLLGAFGRLRRQSRWKATVRGGLVSLEVTYSGRDAPAARRWHAHLHCIVDADWYEQADLLADWRAAMGATGLRLGGARIELPRGGAQSGVDEVVKYFAKGLDLNGWPTHALDELVGWMHGRRMLRTFGSIYNVKLADDDEAPTVEEIEAAEYYDPLTGALVLARELSWRSDEATQAVGWRLAELAWTYRPPKDDDDEGGGACRRGRG